MFMQIVTHVSGRVMALFTAVYTLVKALLCRLANNVRVKFTQAYQSVINLLHHLLQFVRTGLSSNPLAVTLTKAVQSTKAALMSVKASLIQIGLLLQTIVQIIRPPAPTAPLQKKGPPVGVTKSARSRTKKSKTAPTPTATPSTQGGLKLLDRAKQLLQRVSKLFKAKL